MSIIDLYRSVCTDKSFASEKSNACGVMLYYYHLKTRLMNYMNSWVFKSDNTLVLVISLFQIWIYSLKSIMLIIVCLPSILGYVDLYLPIYNFFVWSDNYIIVCFSDIYFLLLVAALLVILTLAIIVTCLRCRSKGYAYSKKKVWNHPFNSHTSHTSRFSLPQRYYVIVKERCRVDYHIWNPWEALASSGFCVIIHNTKFL